MKLLISLTTVFLSFFINAQLFKPNNSVKIDSIQITEIAEVFENDILFSLTVPVLFPAMQVTPSAFNLNVGGDLRLKSLKYGGLNLNYYYSIFVTEIGISPSMYGTRDISHNNLTIQYSLPLWKVINTEETSIFLLSEKGKYVTGMNTAKYTSVNLLLGYAQQYNLSASGAYAKILFDKYDNPKPLGSYSNGFGAWLNQSISMIQVGTSIQQNFNTSFLARDKFNERYKGRRTTSLVYFFNLNFAVATDLAEVKYFYSTGETIYPNSTGGNSSSNKIEEIIDMSEYVPLRKVGFSLGFEYSIFSYKNRVGVNKIGVEVGSFPGYTDNVVESLYAKIKFIGIGFGFMTNELRDW